MTRFFFALALSLCSLAPAAQAQRFDFCEALWVTRNLIFDRAGYCFGSVLGQSLFDNSNCVTNTAAAPPEYDQIVQWARGDESRLGCQVNTSVPAWNSIRAVHAYYNQFQTTTVPVDGGYACWGYSGPNVPVHAGAATSTALLGQLQSGLSYSTTHYSVLDWRFITVSTGPGGQSIVTGWAPDYAFSGSSCAQEAG